MNTFMQYSRTPYIWPEPYRAAALISIDVDAESPIAWMNRGKYYDLLSEVEQRRFGPRVGVWRLLDLLDEFNAKSTFFVPGSIANRYPHLLVALVERGHEVGLHGFHHERVNELTEEENAAVLDRSIEIYKQQLGASPVGYRSPSWELTPVVHRLLVERDISYDSSLSSLDHPYTLGKLAEVPVQWLTEDTIYFRFTGGPQDRTHPENPAAVLSSWIEEFEGIREFGGMVTFTLHPWVSGRAQRIRMLRQLMTHMRAAKDVWWATAEEIAQWHTSSVNATSHQLPVMPLDTNIGGISSR